MLLQTYQTILQVTPILAIFTIFSTGCDPAKPTVYEIPKEERSATVTSQPDQTTVPPITDPTKMQVLPGMQEAANSAPELSYKVPEGWQELEPSGIRKGNFKISSNSETAEVTILTFPGDVGGTLANINRWRGQIGLSPVASEDIGEFSESCEIARHKGLYVRLKGETQSVLGAILPVHGNTWFFKMLGDTSVVLANETSMKQFLNSVQFMDHAH